jgi:hypothetical protein
MVKKKRPLTYDKKADQQRENGSRIPEFEQEAIQGLQSRKVFKCEKSTYQSYRLNRQQQ